jgi:hypothetical protein
MPLGAGIQPVCMFVTSAGNVALNCMGCVGQKGEKFARNARTVQENRTHVAFRRMQRRRSLISTIFIIGKSQSITGILIHL